MGIRAIVTIAASASVGLAAFAVLAQTQSQTGQPAGATRAFPDLASGLKATPGCLGMEMAQTASGKNVIFAWFEDKSAVMRWYSSEVHQQAMDMMPDHVSGQAHRAPMEGIADDFGPIMAVASITMADQERLEETNLPVSQIAVELYAPLPGGLFLGGRFAPDSVKVADLADYTPK